MFTVGESVWHTPPPEYISIQVFMRSNDEASTDEADAEELRLESCEENSYRETVSEEHKPHIDTGLCVTDEDYEKVNLHAAPVHQKSSIYEIRVSKCHGKTTCKSETEIQEYLSRNVILLHSAQTVIDYENHDEPMQINVIYPFADRLIPTEEERFIHKVFGLE